MSPKDLRISCSQVRASLSDYLERQPMGTSRESMREHLESCSACRRALHEEKALLDALDRLERLPAPRGFAERTLEAVLPSVRPRESIFVRLTRSLALAAALFLLVMVLVRAFDTSSSDLATPLVDAAAQTLLERGDQIGEGLRTLGQATGSLSDSFEPLGVLGRAGSLVLGKMPASVMGLLILGALAPILIVATIVLRYRLKGVASHVHQ